MKLGGQFAHGPGTASGRYSIIQGVPSVHCSPPSLTFAFSSPRCGARILEGGTRWVPGYLAPCLCWSLSGVSPFSLILLSDLVLLHSAPGTAVSLWCQPTLDELLSIIQLIEFQSSQTLCLRWLKCQPSALWLPTFHHAYFYASGSPPFHCDRNPHCGRLRVPQAWMCSDETAHYPGTPSAEDPVTQEECSYRLP